MKIEKSNSFLTITGTSPKPGYKIDINCVKIKSIEMSVKDNCEHWVEVTILKPESKDPHAKIVERAIFIKCKTHEEVVSLHDIIVEHKEKWCKQRR